MPSNPEEHLAFEQTADRTRAGQGPVLVLAPFGQDATLLTDTLKTRGIDSLAVSDVESFAQNVIDCSAAILTSEALTQATIRRLQEALQQQPFWSDVPLILLTNRIENASYSLLAEALGNITIIQRPLDAASLLTLVTAALRARQKQYEVRALLSETQTQNAEIRALNARLQQSMRETHHRVKNNLQVIAAMVDMQAMEHRQAGSVPLEEMRRLGTHVHTLALVHDMLTKNIQEKEQDERISVTSVLNGLLPLLHTPASGRDVAYDIDEVELDGKQCLALALVTSELFSNALKHGDGDIEVFLSVTKGCVRLQVRDNGPGFPDGFDPAVAANTGLQLVEGVARTDLRASTSYQNHPDGGARVSIEFTPFRMEV